MLTGSLPLVLVLPCCLTCDISLPVTAVETEEDYPFVTDSFAAEMG